ncbi:MAG TPA: hypothetical protein VN419_14525 [Humidesulfovibrio sp.]|nr:hypothetical protein [Humidesulfovibrio sp.]
MLSGFVLFSTLQVITSVGLSPLSVPPTALGAGCLLLLTQSRRELGWKCAGTLGVLLVMASGPLPWTVGKIFYSARYLFHTEMLTSPPLPYLVSCGFLGTLVPKFVLGLSVLGALLMTRAQQKPLRYVAFTFLFYVLVHVVYGAAYLSQRFDFRSLPHPIYLDYATTPFYALFFGYLFLQLFRDVTRRFPDAWASFSARFTSSALLRPPRLLLIAALAYLLVQGVSAFALKRYKPAPQLATTTITEHLALETALRPGSAFRGRSASLLMCGAVTDVEASAGEQADCAGLTFLSTRPGLNNTHSLSNLWFFDIPTIDGYEATLASSFYLLYSRQASTSPWLNNHTGFSRLNAPLLSASGVRFVISPRPLAAPGIIPRRYIHFGSQGIDHQGPVSSQDELLALAGDGNAICLYELSSPNLGQFSPTKTHIVQDMTAALDVLGRPGFDFTQEVVLHEPLPPAQEQRLVPGKLLEPLVVEQSGLRLQAVSEGVSILLLPFEFSRCMSWRPDPGATGAAKLYRANLTMTAFVFSGRVSGKLAYEFGPWTNSWAKLQDLEDLNRMGLRQVPTHPLTGASRYIKVNL